MLSITQREREKKEKKSPVVMIKKKKRIIYIIKNATPMQKKIEYIFQYRQKLIELPSAIDFLKVQFDKFKRY